MNEVSEMKEGCSLIFYVYTQIENSNFLCKIIMVFGIQILKFISYVNGE